MLKPSKLKRFSASIKHPYYLPEIETKLLVGTMVVTVNDEPIKGVICFDVPNGYVKRVLTQEDERRIVQWDDNALDRAMREGLRIKGVVRVYEQA